MIGDILFSLTYRIQELRDYKADPDPDKYNLINLVYIWLYSTCIYNEFNFDPILNDKEWDLLSVHLLEHYKELPNHFKLKLPSHHISHIGGKKIDWSSGVPWLVFRDCEQYALILSWKQPHAV